MSQIDLFAAPPSADAAQERREAKFARWARELEQSGDYRILHRLVPRPSQPGPLLVREKMGVLVDVETTGLDHSKDEIIELGMVAFTYDDAGNVLRILDVFSMLRQPKWRRDYKASAKLAWREAGQLQTQSNHVHGTGRHHLVTVNNVPLPAEALPPEPDPLSDDVPF